MRKRIIQAALLFAILCFCLNHGRKKETEYGLERSMAESEKRIDIVEKAMLFDLMENGKPGNNDEQATDPSQEGILDYSGSTEAFWLDYEKLTAYQSGRKVTDATSKDILPPEVVELLKEEAIQGMKLQDTEEDFWENYKAEDKRISYQEMLTWLGISEEEADEAYWDENCVAACLLDADGDGEKELLMCISSDGSLRYEEICLWEKEGGIAVRTDYADYLTPGNDIPVYIQGRFYLIRGSSDFNTRETTGSDIYTFETGGKLKKYYFQFTNPGQEKDWIQTYVNPEADSELIRQMEGYLKGIRNELEESVYPEGYRIFSGEAEEKVRKWEEDSPLNALFSKLFSSVVSQWSIENCYRVDFDNDGAEEYIRKSIWYPSSYSSSMGLGFVGILKNGQTGFQEYELNLPENFEKNFYNKYGVWVQQRAVQLWFEAFDGKVYTFDLRRLDFEGDHILDISLIEGEELIPILQYVLIDQKEFGLFEIEIERGRR
ncbi:MAG: hypothetical protein IJP31_07160 [Lachnospiraceae bacterium]|nr:hypothetical protein [Lachnospiraceae bacterium]